MKNPGVKDRIITTASELFYKNGYNQTGINQIIDEANVAKASLYQHFRSKEDIAVAFLNKRHYWWMEQLSNFVADCQGAKEILICSFDFLSDWLEKAQFRGCGFQNIITDLPKDQSKIESEVRFHKDQLLLWIHSTLKRHGEYSDNDATEISNQIFVLMEGAMISARIQKSTWPIETAKSISVKILN